MRKLSKDHTRMATDHPDDVVRGPNGWQVWLDDGSTLTAKEMTHWLHPSGAHERAFGNSEPENLGKLPHRVPQNG